MSDMTDEQLAYDHLEALCARIILSEEHQWTRGAINRLPAQWTPLAPLIQMHSEDQAIANDARHFGLEITVYAVKSMCGTRTIVTFYCQALDAITGSALIDALDDIRMSLH